MTLSTLLPGQGLSLLFAKSETLTSVDVGTGQKHTHLSALAIALNLIKPLGHLAYWRIHVSLDRIIFFQESTA
jgi:hypothetical protein